MTARALRGAALALTAAFFIVQPAYSAAPVVPVPTPKPIVPTAADFARFAAFLRDFRAEAIKAGISGELYDKAVAGIRLNPRVQELNLSQPEFVRPIWDYLAGAVSEIRVRNGREAAGMQTALLSRLEKDYGVQREVLTAIWGLETAYGVSEGTFNLFESLATLAYDGPRAAYGKRQFLAALKIAQGESHDPKSMYSSWAGAFGETQFVPTTFLEYAIDGDADGKRDPWNSPADALASTAHYLKESGWLAGQSWGEEVKLPADFPYDQADPESKKSIEEWTALGVRNLNGEALSGMDQTAIFLPAGYRGPAFLVRENFGVILKYNFATSYALAVGLLADRVKGADGVKGAWPTEITPLDEASRVSLQSGLSGLGYDAGEADGVFGRRTRGALREYQKARGIPADGFPTPELLTRILNERAAKP